MTLAVRRVVGGLDWGVTSEMFMAVKGEIGIA